MGELKKRLKFFSYSGSAILPIVPIVGMIYMLRLRADVKLEFREPLLVVWLFFIAIFIGEIILLAVEIRKFRVQNNADNPPEKKRISANEYVRWLKFFFGNISTYVFIISFVGWIYSIGLISYVTDFSIAADVEFNHNGDIIRAIFAAASGTNAAQFGTDIRRFLKRIRDAEQPEVLGIDRKVL
jgi:hypothetical protein